MTVSNGLVGFETVLRTSSHLPLKTSFSFQPKELEFWRAQTGIEDVDDLKQHIIDVQREAYAVLPYGCIRYLDFVSCRIADVPDYERLIKLGRVCQGSILLDVGCCFGTDVRKATADGWPVDRIVATDIEPGFWELGHKLFCSNAKTFPAVFLPGNIFDPTHLAPPSADFINDPGDLVHTSGSLGVPPLKLLTSLNPLRGHVSAIYAGALFHLFSEDRQTTLARALASLLTPAPGSMIVGWQAGAPHKGVRVITRVPDHTPRAGTSRASAQSLSQFCHSPESWAELWDGQVFERGSVKVKTNLVKPENVPEGVHDYYALYWSVTRL